MNFFTKNQELIWNILLVIAFALCLLIPIACGGCRYNNISKVEYYPDGETKSEYFDNSTGFCEWSDGAGKVMPLGNLSLNGVGVGK